MIAEQRSLSPNGFLMLPNVFWEKHYDYTLIKRTGLFAIYKKTKEGYGAHCFEVIKIRENPAYIICNKVIEAKEIFPSNEMWGFYGFTCLTLTEAEKKMKKMIALEGKKI